MSTKDQVKNKLQKIVDHPLVGVGVYHLIERALKPWARTMMAYVDAIKDSNEEPESEVLFGLPDPGQGEVFYAAFDEQQDQNSNAHFMRDLSGNNHHPTNRANMSNWVLEAPMFGKRTRHSQNNPFEWRVSQSSPLPGILNSAENVRVDILHHGIRQFGNDNLLIGLQPVSAVSLENRFRVATWNDGLQVVANGQWEDTTLNIRQFSGTNIPSMALTYVLKSDSQNASNSIHEMWVNGIRIWSFSAAKVTLASLDKLVVSGNHIWGFLRIWNTASQEPAAWHKEVLPWSV